MGLRAKESMVAVERGKMSFHHIPSTLAPQELAFMHTTIPINCSTSNLAIDLGSGQIFFLNGKVGRSAMVLVMARRAP
jgi:hypothetical protein